MSPEIGSQMPDYVPRKASPGEEEQAAASNVKALAHRLGLTLSERAALALGRFATNVLTSLNEEDQRKAAEQVARFIKWWVGKD